jgi:hypothetical protein
MDVFVAVDRGRKLERQVAETAQVFLGDPPLALEDLRKAIELGETERRLHRRHAVIEADLRVVVAPSRRHCVVAKQPQTPIELRVRGEHHPAFAGRHHLVAVEAEARDVAERADRAAAVARAVRLGRVLDEHRAGAPRDVAERRHVARLTVEMDGDDRLGAARDARAHGFRIDVPGETVGIGEDRLRARIAHGVRRRHERQRRHDDFVARTDAERGERQVEGRRAVRGRDAEAALA